MKAIYEFDLSEPSEMKEHFRMAKAVDLSIALWDCDIELRNKLKYDEGELTECEYKILEKVHSRFREILRENNVEFILEGE